MDGNSIFPSELQRNSSRKCRKFHITTFKTSLWPFTWRNIRLYASILRQFTNTFIWVMMISHFVIFALLPFEDVILSFCRQKFANGSCLIDVRDEKLCNDSISSVFLRNFNDFQTFFHYFDQPWFFWPKFLVFGRSSRLILVYYQLDEVSDRRCNKENASAPP